MNTKVNNVPSELYEEIKKEITNKDSVVGIDAVHTHIIIIDRLMEIEKKLDSLNEKIEELKSTIK